MTIAYPIPVAAFAMMAILVFLFARRGRAIKCVLVASYCGVIVVSFTGGASGGVWLVQLFLLAVGLPSLWQRAMPAHASRYAALLTYGMCAVYAVGILVGLARYDATLETIKAGTFTHLMGIPTRVLMAGYRAQIILWFVVAFALPLRYRVDRRFLEQCLTLGWGLSLVVAALGIADYLGLGNFAYSYRREAGYGHIAVFGFHRAAIGMMMVLGIFLTFMMSQLTHHPLKKAVAYLSLPVLVVALIFTFSRAAMIAMLAGVASLVFTLGGARAIKGMLITGLATLTVGLVLFQIPEARERFGFLFTGTFEGGSAGRLEGWQELVSWLVRSPDVLMTGVGFQNFLYFANLHAGAVTLQAAHNTFLHVLTETGFMGFAVFIAWITSLFVWLWSWRRAATDWLGRMIPGVFISMLVAIVVSSLTQESLTPSPSMVAYLLHFHLLLGLWMAHYRTESLQIPGKGSPFVARPRQRTQATASLSRTPRSIG